jgi:hypothetical protein
MIKMKKIFVFFAVSILFLTQPLKVKAEARDPLDGIDYRKLRLYHFLKEKDSPLKTHTDDFIHAADVWDIDWRLLPAITGLESAYGTRLVPNSYNGYGWAGGYFYFEGWDQSIFYVSRKLKNKYYQQGLNTPYKIGSVYAPPNPHWGGLIASIMTEI